jgi:hypothetical protein
MWAVPTLQDHRSNWIENKTGYDFFSALPINVQSAIESNSNPIPLTSPLLASNSSGEIVDNFTRWQNSILEVSTREASSDRPTQVSSLQECFLENSISEVSISEVSTNKLTPCEISSSKIGIGKISILKESTVEKPISEISIGQISSTQIRISQVDIPHNCPTQISGIEFDPFTFNPRQVGSTQIRTLQIYPIQQNTLQVSFLELGASQGSKPQISTGQINTTQIGSTQIESAQFKSIDITLQQFLSSHNFDLQNRTVPLWTEFLQSPTPFNLKVEITDLPTGQLAEGTITGYDSNGRPNSGTLTIDSNGNGQGWFIDTTPGDNSEFDQQLTETAYRATSGEAAGKYDLLTAILHELGHLQGIIQGNSEFDRNIKNGKFITDTISAQLTPDGSHLDSTLYPYDLLNTSLKPGIRKLPSQLDLAIINQLYSHPANQNPTPQNPNAALTAGALYAIENGDFTTTTGWNLQGGTTISNGAATLSEASQKLAQLTQDLIIPAGAKRLQFTIKDNHLVLGDNSKTASDAFEVALLNSSTFKPLAGTSQGLNNTDSLLNIQANGTTYKSNKVTITPLTATSEVVSIDISDITPETKATLYFNLLGFGPRTSTVTIALTRTLR